MPSRGFFAELQYQARLATQERQRAERVAFQHQIEMARLCELAKKDEERAQSNLARAASADSKRLEKEFRAMHVAAKESESAEKNSTLKQIYDELDSLLVSTLAVDDHVDLRSLRAVVTHPPFDRTDLEVPIPPPKHSREPPKPSLTLPAEPEGLASLFGKKKYEEAMAVVRRAHEKVLSEWRAACRKSQTDFQHAEITHAHAEVRRIAALQLQRERYAKECSARESEAAGHNKRLLELIANLGYGTPEAIHEYITIVLSNSAYPEHFPVTHEFEFDPSTAELRLSVCVSPPAEVSSAKAYKYNKSADEITATSRSQKECRETYASAVHQVALRSFHEVFESDRRGLIRTISLEVGTKTVDPATGQRTYMPFVCASAEREAFLQFDLSAVVPAMTLQRLAAAISKNPYSLVAADRSGIRRS